MGKGILKAPLHPINSCLFPTCCHESCSGDIVGQVKRIANDLEDRHEVVVADDGEGEDEVGRDQDVDHDPAVVPLLRGEEVARKFFDGRFGTVGLSVVGSSPGIWNDFIWSFYQYFIKQYFIKQYFFLNECRKCFNVLPTGNETMSQMGPQTPQG